MPPKVSICIPAYNQVDCLRKTLDSVASQEFTDYEVIVTDDSPNDSVMQLLREYSASDRFRYFRNPHRKGSPGNWNEAVRHASGEFIKILHHDDWFAQTASLRKYVELLEGSPDSDFAFSATQVVDFSDGDTRLHIATPEQIEKLREEPTVLFQGNFVGSPSATICRRASSRPYDEDLKWLVDVDYYVRTLRENVHFAYSNEPLIATLDNAPHQVTSECLGNPRVDVFEHLYLYEKIREFVPESRSREYISFLDGRLAQFGVDTIDFIRDTGYAGPIPRELSSGMLRRRILSMLFVRPLAYVKRRVKGIVEQNPTE
jgi:glycosyltransferase involved in cell wall biosynthesis